MNKKIKRYEIDGLNAYINCKDPKFTLEDFESWDGDICFYAEHERIIQSLEDKNKELEDRTNQLTIDNIRHEEAIRLQNLTVESMKCCGNCSTYGVGTCYRDIKSFRCNYDFVCDNWKLKE